MNLTDCFFMDGFSMQDAMSAIEIGEPRLDSGIPTNDGTFECFDPRALLLPEELVWIIDRSFAYETEWHFGGILAHTVLTLNYVHQIFDLDLDLMSISSDPERPRELVGVVLKAFVVGLLKTCDYTWRTLQHGDMIDTEDWQSDKCDTSLLEGMQLDQAYQLLDNALMWLQYTKCLAEPWRGALVARLTLRKAVLDIIATGPMPPDGQNMRFWESLQIAKTALHQVMQAQPIPEPRAGSPARRAFDPYIARKLNTLTPIRVVPLRGTEWTWKTLDRLVSGMSEACALRVDMHMSTWQLVGNWYAWEPDRPLTLPVVRSVIASIFSRDGVHFGKYTVSWTVDRFFDESVGVSYTDIVMRVRQRWNSNNTCDFSTLANTLDRVCSEHIVSQWYNPPRRRRMMVKSLASWHEIYEMLSSFVANIDSSFYSPSRQDLWETDVLRVLPQLALKWRLEVQKEIVLSGFQLELYAAQERPFAYWYLSEILKALDDCVTTLMDLPSLKSHIPERPVYLEKVHELVVNGVLQRMATALFAITLPLVNTSASGDRQRPGFVRRYKWAFDSVYASFDTAPVCQPDYTAFQRACIAMMKNTTYNPAAELAQAKSTIEEALSRNSSMGAWASAWRNTRIKYMKNLQKAVDGLAGVPSSVADIPLLDQKRLVWDPSVHPWFPHLRQNPS
ncbi:hypothetical protein FISHEDRAFT_59008 [Fistulina hepatica ATCC 64428]|uniref:Mak10-domain-containing protein n=1 Tax=Fistulina hepatica ATCC 64428 TaxID=1128425 RepID=A0A0D7ABF7_9AGAR|nr:hypothetical protein FISHEDRAFT_59008 [Fistulina hepatica ATCC 64428]